MALKGTELQWLWDAVDKFDVVKYIKDNEETRRIKEMFPMTNYFKKPENAEYKIRMVDTELSPFYRFRTELERDYEKVLECPVCAHLSAETETCFYCGEELSDPDHSLDQCIKESHEAIRALEYKEYYRKEKLQRTFQAVEQALDEEIKTVRKEKKESLSNFHFFLQMSTMTFDALVEDDWVCCQSDRESNSTTTSSFPFMAVAVMGTTTRGQLYPNLRLTSDLQRIFGTILFEYASGITDAFPVQIDDSLAFGKAVIRKHSPKDTGP